MPTLATARPLDEVPQRTENGVVYVPLRLTAYAHGATVEWDSATRTAYITTINGGTWAFVINDLIREVGGFVESPGITWIPLDFAVKLFAPALPQAHELEDVVLIVTGRYGHATPEMNEWVTAMMGGENSQERFNIYFNWKNTVHEVGHVVEAMILTERMLRGEEFEWEFFDSERFANAFALAFWAHYGDEETFNTLREIVAYAAKSENFIRPIAENEDIYDFAHLFVAGEIEFSMNNYGWFQFNLVNYLLEDVRDMQSVLADIGFVVDVVPPRRTLSFSSIGEYNINEILATVFAILRDEWGIPLPTQIFHGLSDDPNAHMMIFLHPGVIVEISDALGLGSEILINELLEILFMVNFDEHINVTRVLY